MAFLKRLLGKKKMVARRKGLPWHVGDVVGGSTSVQTVPFPFSL
jgi:hypothetical protein